MNDVELDALLKDPDPPQHISFLLARMDSLELTEKELSALLFNAMIEMKYLRREMVALMEDNEKLRGKPRLASDYTVVARDEDFAATFNAVKKLNENL